MDSPRLVRAVLPARIGTSTTVFAAGIVFAVMSAAATIASLDPPATHQRALPPPAYHWQLDHDGTDATGHLDLRSAYQEPGGGSAPLYQDGERGNTVGVFGGCRAFYCFGRALESPVPVDLGLDFTISAWVYWEPATFAYDHHSILGNGQLVLGKRGGFVEVIVGGALLENSTPLVHDRWTHVVVTRRGADLSLWVDGNESRMPLDAPPGRAETLYLGRNASGYPWNGMIDDVIVWDHALDARQIAAIR